MQQAKAIVLALVAIIVGGAACRQANHPQQAKPVYGLKASLGWFIQSWQDGNTVMEFDGKVYEGSVTL